MKKLLFITTLVVAALQLQAQKVDNVRASSSGDQIYILYDLSGSKSGQLFKVNLYSSHNNFASPVQQVTGNVGDNVAPGKDKRIIWNAKSELANFKGSLSFEVRADLMVVEPPVVKQQQQTVDPNQFVFGPIASAKRGGNLAITWKGGTPSESVKLELMKEGVSQITLATTKNSGSYNWSVPDDAKTGSFQVRITGASGSATSATFAIKHKIATGLKVLPVVVIAGVLAATAGGGGGGGGGATPTGSGDLVGPPSPQ